MGHFVRCRQPHVYLEVVEQNVRNHSGHEVLLEDSSSEPAFIWWTWMCACLYLRLHDRPRFLLTRALRVHLLTCPNILSLFTLLWCTGKELCSVCSVSMAANLQLGLKFRNIHCIDHFWIQVHLLLCLCMESYFLYSPISDPFPLFFLGFFVSLKSYTSRSSLSTFIKLLSNPNLVIHLSSCTGSFTNTPST